ncbi:MAG TPA: helix-turn-helix domain-containing protein [Candidatus Syntrophosphaera sp.]|nr:helix-turn-helix domain-containing protein [Candidatus Syntrophosphaera sp.]
MEIIRLYTLTEVADILRVTRRTLYNYIKSGKLKAVKMGREWRITYENLKDFIESGTNSQK